jgi:hypothetical protein
MPRAGGFAENEYRKPKPLFTFKMPLNYCSIADTAHENEMLQDAGRVPSRRANRWEYVKTGPRDNSSGWALTTADPEALEIFENIR